MYSPLGAADNIPAAKLPSNPAVVSSVWATVAVALTTTGVSAEAECEPALSLHYELNDGSAKDITYYKADQNFYTVVYENGTKAASTNKLYVNIMLDDLKKLAGGI